MHIEPTVLKAIVAFDRQGGMGKANRLPWHLPEDLQIFKQKTFHQPMVMGRKTFESFQKPLPGRLHLVLTRDKDFTYHHPDVKIFHDPRSLMTFVNGFGGTVWFIGGAQIFRLFHDFIDEYHITHIHGQYDADTFFPISQEELLSTHHVSSFMHYPNETAFDITTYTRD